MKSKYDIIWIDSTDSTNEEAARQISRLDNLSVVSACRQTAGRGQRGNTWSSAPGENLTFSIVLKCPLEAYDQFAISEAAALAVVDLLSDYGLEGKIKWPNDIYVGNRKICGILIENSIKGTALSHSIAGIGLNVNQSTFDPSIPNPTSFALETGRNDFDVRKMLEEFMDIFAVYCNRYLHSNGGLGRLRRMYLSQMWRIGETAEFIDYTRLPQGHIDGPVGIADHGTTEGRRFTGTITGLNDVGNLKIKDHTDGMVLEFGFKEIGYIL